MTEGKLCTMNLNHLMNTISIYVNSDCIECRKYSKHEHYRKKKQTKKNNKKTTTNKQKKNKGRIKECYTEFIEKNANYKKKNSNTHCFLKKLHKSI